jgi:methylglutaconyl-CoA hydratase
MEFIEFEKRDRVGIITLNRPEKRNAMHPGLVEEMTRVMEQFQTDEQVKVVLIRANGPAFCAGADLAYLQSLQAFSYEENLADSIRLKDFFHFIYRFPKPVMAQVAGAALAGGAGLLSVCDFVVAVPEALVGYTEVRIGFIPAIVSPFLVKKIGEGRAKEMLLSGNLYRADDEQLSGLVTMTAAASELEKATWDFITKMITSNSATAMAATKKLLLDQDPDLPQRLSEAAKQNALARSTTDCKRGIRAFLDKQNLIW